MEQFTLFVRSDQVCNLILSKSEIKTLKIKGGFWTVAHQMTQNRNASPQPEGQRNFYIIKIRFLVSRVMFFTPTLHTVSNSVRMWESRKKFLILAWWHWRFQIWPGKMILLFILVGKCLFAGIAAGVSVPILMDRLGALCFFGEMASLAVHCFF